jgi:hypothetical protein
MHGSRDGCQFFKVFLYIYIYILQHSISHTNRFFNISTWRFDFIIFYIVHIVQCKVNNILTAYRETRLT